MGKNRLKKYLIAPLDYCDPEMGKFKLHFSISSNFKENYPTLLIVKDGQQPDNVKELVNKEKNDLGGHINVVAIQPRGSFHSFIDTDVNQPEIYSYTQFIRDIELVRVYLIGEKKWSIIGDSGGGLLSLQYLSEFSNHIDKVIAITPPIPGVLGSKLESKYIQETFNFWGYDNLLDILPPEIEKKYFCWLINRVGYLQPLRSMDTLELIKPILNGDFKKIKDLTLKLLSQEQMIAILKKYPAFKYRVSEVFDRKYVSPILRLALDPLIDKWSALNGTKLINEVKLFENLENVKNKTLLVGGVHDHVVQPEMLRKWNDTIINAELVLLESTHNLAEHSNHLNKIKSNFLFSNI